MNQLSRTQADGRHALRPLCGQLCILLGLAFLALPTVQPRAAEAITAAGVISRGEECFRTLQSYECTADVQSRLGKRGDSGTVQFWFKQPRMLRLKVVRGKGKGS